MKMLRWLVSSKNYELKIVFATLGVLVALPIISVVVFASSGLSIISSALASINPITKLVEIFDPNGNKVAEITVSATWPTRGYVSDEFGTFSNFRKENRLGAHSGVDIANNFGINNDPVTTFAVGKVVKIREVDDNGCGKFVRVDHGNHIQSLYCHLDNVETTEQAEVKPGDILGRMGSTGISTGAHTHMQIEVYGIPVNPRTFLTGDPEPSQLQ